ncbi:phage baseplate protein [Serratia fonticola]|uniref:phage baseplate protein n=1 Tax=Serratia fonticola TaxID=47917 RepID=UPI00093A8991|nr:phage baseplate protein [Serratia fonticola]OKP31368.1 phage baseplate protein [Serratia fonticola]
MSNGQKNFFMKSLAEHGQGAIDGNGNLDGKGWPCHVTAVNGSIVTVMFDILPGNYNLPEVTIPVFGPEYIRYPIQVGDEGVTIPLSVSIRNVTGLGVGLPDLSTPPSLTALFFMPVGNINWEAVDPDQVTIYGPNGVLLQTTGKDSSVNVEPGKITIKAEHIYLNGIIHLNGQIVQDADQMQSGTTAKLIGPLLVENDTTAGGISLTGHKHDVKNVEPGSAARTSEKPQ